ncbi:hypothetical protein [Chryseobacterium potabilaquae]|uniref:Uncharacterized protein n=1 Tax=Chryseobacterium potabilaquae TaxID=2675057 RepID=A0A6N4XAH8_9FLAO|nr:hypothetical protein [Chryseobacterium potabilaquae]CAA7196712.1 hypothetical protein CHRY9293_02787 [Chryseobacterium potabilaquae]
MIAQKKYCEIVLNDPNILGELIKKMGREMRLQSIESALKRGNASIRRTAAFIETLEYAGYKKEEIIEKEREL